MASSMLIFPYLASIGMCMTESVLALTQVSNQKCSKCSKQPARSQHIYICVCVVDGSLRKSKCSIPQPRPLTKGLANLRTPDRTWPFIQHRGHLKVFLLLKRCRVNVSMEGRVDVPSLRVQTACARCPSNCVNLEAPFFGAALKP